jgi:Holliday junction resolvase RusA-like endonuclease
MFLTASSHRCDAPAKNLDGDVGGRRTHNLTKALFDVLDGGTLWNDYGIVDEILVC